ncbi:hypothetical protein Lser_V15G39815 [Lactuca serriola]
MSDGDLSKELDDRFRSQCGDILVFFDALDNCNSESVNVKVLTFFKKFLDLDLVHRRRIS